MRLSKAEITRIAEDLNAMEKTMENPTDNQVHAENVGAYFYMQSLLLNFNSEIANKVYWERERLKHDVPVIIPSKIGV